MFVMPRDIYWKAKLTHSTQQKKLLNLISTKTYIFTYQYEFEVVNYARGIRYKFYKKKACLQREVMQHFC